MYICLRMFLSEIYSFSHLKEHAKLQTVSSCQIRSKLNLPSISMEVWVIFVVRLLTNWLGNVAQNSINVSTHYFHQMTCVKTLNGWPQKNFLKSFQ